MLTKEDLLSRCQVDSLSKISSISMWGCDIEDISILSQVQNITVLSLSVNKITSLSPLSSCIRLRELYLRKNRISSLSEIDNLIPCKHLSILWLEENPICTHPDYHPYIIKTLPHITKLDNEIIRQPFPFLTVNNEKSNEGHSKEHCNGNSNSNGDKGAFGDAIKRMRRATSSIDGSKTGNNNNNTNNDKGCDSNNNNVLGGVSALQHSKNESSSFMKFNYINYSLGDVILQTEKELKTSKAQGYGHCQFKKDKLLFKKIKLKISSDKRGKKNLIPKYIQLNKLPLSNEDNKVQLTKNDNTNNEISTTNINSNDHIIKAILNLMEKMSIGELRLISNEIDSMFHR